MQYAYLCDRGARKFHRAGLDRADLRQVAALGLIKAAERYDPGLRTPFEAFAWLFVVGELMHHVRDHERLVRPPRRLRDLERRYQTVHEQLVGELHREPSIEEIRQRLRICSSDFEDVRRYRHQAVPESIAGLSPQEMLAQSYTLGDREDRIFLDAAMAQLTDLERKVVLALYDGGFTQIEIARRLGYSARHISRVHRSALKRMLNYWDRKTA